MPQELYTYLGGYPDMVRRISSDARLGVLEPMYTIAGKYELFILDGKTFEMKERVIDENVEREYAVAESDKKANRNLRGRRNGERRRNRNLLSNEQGRESGNVLEQVGANGESPHTRTNKDVISQNSNRAIIDTSKGAPKQGASSISEAEEGGTKHRLETDEDTLDFLDKQDTIKVYRAMQLIDDDGNPLEPTQENIKRGKLVPPMAGKIKDENGKWVWQEAAEYNKWYRSDERPELANDKGNFILKKGTGGTDIPARYNPYWHTSATPLNDQFTSAYNRPNLVVVEGEIPSSELTSGYKADKAKDSAASFYYFSSSPSLKAPPTL